MLFNSDLTHSWIDSCDTCALTEFTSDFIEGSNDEVDERYSEKYLEHEYEECLDDYGIDEEEYKRHPFRVFKFTSILFVILFLTNWILIMRLSRRKRLELTNK